MSIDAYLYALTITFDAYNGLERPLDSPLFFFFFYLEHDTTAPFFMFHLIV